MIRRFSILIVLVSSLVSFGAGAFPTSAHAALPDTVFIRVQGGGRVIATPNRVCTSECEFSYGEDSNALVNVAADPSPGWKFSHWDSLYPGNPNPTNDICFGSTTPVCQVNFATRDYVWAYFAAVFVPDVQIVSAELSVTSSAGGKVTGPGIDCPGDCTQNFATFPLKQVVTLTVMPSPGFALSSWGGACTGNPSSCVLLMSEDREVNVTFVPTLTSTTLNVTVGGGGTVTGQGISCPGDCSQAYVKLRGQANPVVALTATASPGFKLAWLGDCSGSQPSCVLTMSQDHAVKANFVPDLSGGGPAPGNPVGNPGPGNPGTPGNPGGPGGSSKPGPGSPFAEESCTVKGTPGPDVLRGTPGHDVICGFGGNDRLLGRAGNDILVGGSGADVIDGGAGRDFLYGRAGRDRLTGRAGRDRLDAGLGNDRLTGGSGADRFLGGKGADVLVARDEQRDRLDGGPGRDRARIDRSRDVRKRIESTF